MNEWENTCQNVHSQQNIHTYTTHPTHKLTHKHTHTYQTYTHIPHAHHAHTTYTSDTTHTTPHTHHTDTTHPTHTSTITTATRSQARLNFQGLLQLSNSQISKSFVLSQRASFYFSTNKACPLNKAQNEPVSCLFETGFPGTMVALLVNSLSDLPSLWPAPMSFRDSCRVKQSASDVFLWALCSLHICDLYL